MIVRNTAMQAYQSAMNQASKIEGRVGQSLRTPQEPTRSFTDTMRDSLHQVNEMQAEKSQMIEEFASGKNQNVHELMITMQKAALTMSMTNAVRSKIMQSYQEIMRMPF